MVAGVDQDVYIIFIFRFVLNGSVTDLLLHIVNLGQYLGGIAAWMAGFGIHMSGTDLAVSVAPFLNMVITVPINFLVNKFWAYRQK